MKTAHAANLIYMPDPLHLITEIREGDLRQTVSTVFCLIVSAMNSCAVCVMVFLMVSVPNVFAGPRNRVKRVSDTHFADLQSRIALNNKVKGVSITMPVGGGRFDPAEIGRRRRSESRFLDVLFNQSEEDKGDPVDLNDYELLQRFRDFE